MLRKSRSKPFRCKFQLSSKNDWFFCVDVMCLFFALNSKFLEWSSIPERHLRHTSSLALDLSKTKKSPQLETLIIITMSFEIPSPFQWDESFCVGNAEINEQHKKLFQLINALDADRTNGAVLKELLDYVVMHFKTEEDGFDRVAWDQKDAHKEVHDNFVKTAVSLTSVDDGVIQFIKQWLVDHIKGSDMKYKGVL